MWFNMDKDTRFMQNKKFKFILKKVDLFYGPSIKILYVSMLSGIMPRPENAYGAKQWV